MGKATDVYVVDLIYEASTHHENRSLIQSLALMRSAIMQLAPIFEYLHVYTRNTHAHHASRQMYAMYM